MNNFMVNREAQAPPNYFRVAWQSGLAAALGLGLPAGLLLWLILLRELTHSSLIDQTVTLLRTNGLNSIFILAICSLLWSFLLGKISGYRAWGRIGLGTILGIFAGWFSPLSNLDGLLPGAVEGQWPVHTLYAVSMSGIVASVTLCVGLAYGVILRNAKAALVLALTTSFISVSSVVLTIQLFDQFGIRVGTGNFAMSKVTTVNLLVSAITGGMALGIGFTAYLHNK